MADPTQDDVILGDREAIRLALDSAAMGVWTWDVAADRVSWSSQVELIFATRVASFADYAALIHNDDRVDVLTVIGDAAAGRRESYRLRHRIVRPGGEVRWLDCHGRIGRDAVGVVSRMFGTAIDITERTNAESAQRASEERLSAIIANTPNVAMQGYDRAGRVLFWNRASESLFGWSASDAIGRLIEELMLTPADADAFRATMAEIAADGKSRGPTEYPVKRRDGGSAWSLSTVFTIPGDDGPIFVCSDVDITEHKRAEERLLQAAKIETIGRLAGGVAHDFNNLLTVILGYAELIEPVIPGAVPAAGHLRNLREAATRGSQLTAQLLAFARKQVIRPQVIDLNQRIERVLDLLRRLIGEQVELTTALAPDAGSVLIDPGQLEQVLMNLAVNARDAMPQGGRLTLSTRRVPAVVDAANINALDRVAIVVRDTGPGIPEAMLDRIFEPFFTTKPNGSGTGLGLATCQNIVSEHGGAIVARNAPGGGAEIEFVLTTVEGRGDDSPEQRHPTPTAGRECVLLVEDEASIRELVAKYLGGLGYQVMTADDGEAALALARTEPRIDVLITDLVMPRLGGIALARLLLAERPQLKVVFTSGYNEDPSELASFAQPVAFLQKPYQLKVLAEQTRRVLGA